MLRLRGGQFAIGMWVVAEVFALLVTLDQSLGGGTGISLGGLNVFAPGLPSGVHVLDDARVHHGAARTASSSAPAPDRELAAGDSRRRGGRRVAGRQASCAPSACSSSSPPLAAASAGALYLANTLFIQTTSVFGVQWTAYMIFMVLVGGLGTFEGPIIGAIIFYLIQAQFGDSGAWYFIGLGAIAIAFALFLPHGSGVPSTAVCGCDCSRSATHCEGSRLGTGSCRSRGNRHVIQKSNHPRIGGRAMTTTVNGNVRECTQFIGGEWVAASDGRVYDDLDPFTGDVVARVAAGDARRCAPRDRSSGRRVPRVVADACRRTAGASSCKAADILERRRDEVVCWLARETGASFGFGDVPDALRPGPVPAGRRSRVRAARPDPSRRTCRARWRWGSARPVGVVAAIAPWNAALILSARSIAAPLVLGNTVVLKPSEDSPYSRRPAVGRDLRRGRPAGGRAQHRHPRARRGRPDRRRARRESHSSAGSTSRVRPRPAGGSPRLPGATSSGWCSSSAVRTR